MAWGYQLTLLCRASETLYNLTHFFSSNAPRRTFQPSYLSHARLTLNCLHQHDILTSALFLLCGTRATAWIPLFFSFIGAFSTHCSGFSPSHFSLTIPFRTTPSPTAVPLLSMFMSPEVVAGTFYMPFYWAFSVHYESVL